MNHQFKPSKTSTIFLSAFLFLFLCVSAHSNPIPGFYNITDYGAVADGKTLNTQSIQKAIDDCTGKGGGTVYFPPGKYLSGTLVLKNYVTLYLENGAVLLGSTNLNDYPEKIPAFRSYTDNYTTRSLIYAEKVENIAIIGQGKIDGQGDAKSFQYGRPASKYYRNRPYLIRMIECRTIQIRDVTIVNSPMWVQHYLACEDLLIDGITVHSRVNHNNDGIDIDCCNQVSISNCNISSGDDAIVLKATSNRPCQNVTISNCILSSACNAFKCGTESNGGFRNITLSNCTIYDTRLSGIALEMVDGGTFERVSVSNITMDNIEGGIFIRLGNRARSFIAKEREGSIQYPDQKSGLRKPPVGVMRDIIISNVQATGVGKVGCSVTGLPGHPLQNVTLQDIRIQYRGGGSLEDALNVVPEKPDSYPEHSMFGILPAYGFYCRHVENLKLQNVVLKFSTDDFRPALVCTDVTDLDLLGFDAQSVSRTPAVIRLENVDGAFSHGSRQSRPTRTMFSIDALSKNISIMNCDFSQVNNIFEESSMKDKVYWGDNRK